MSNLIIDPITKTYSRYTNNQNEILKLKLTNLYNCANVQITNSGLHSNYIALEIATKLNPDYNIIYINELYHESIEIIKLFNKSDNIYMIDINNNLSYDNLLTNNQIINKYNILFIESCTNPNGYIFDYILIDKLKNISSKLIVICDNSWLTNHIFNPFDYDIDIITISLTKYYSGGNAICGGCIIKDNTLFEQFDKYIRISGIHISQLQTSIINQYIDQTLERLTKQSLNTLSIIKYISESELYRNNNIIINHPSVKTHIAYDNAIKYFKNNLYPSTFTIGFNINKEKLTLIINNLKIFNIETSFGSKLTIIDNYIFNLNNYSYIRISIGYNDSIEYIKSGIDELLNFI